MCLLSGQPPLHCHAWAAATAAARQPLLHALRRRMLASRLVGLGVNHFFGVPGQPGRGDAGGAAAAGSCAAALPGVCPPSAISLSLVLLPPKQATSIWPCWTS